MSIRQLAKLTGFSVAPVSKALRHDSKVSSATLDLVQQAARKIDYSPNPYVGQGMSSMRRRNTANFRGNIALVFKDSSLPLAADVRHKQIIKGVRERLEELGYQIDEFELIAKRPESLGRILHARGIRGVLFSMPSFSGSKVRLRMNLDTLCCVSLGWGLWIAELDSVRVAHYQIVRGGTPTYAASISRGGSLRFGTCGPIVPRSIWVVPLLLSTILQRLLALAELLASAIQKGC